MPKHETKNVFYWIIWELDTLVMRFDQFMLNYKKSTKSLAWKLVLVPLLFIRNYAQPLLGNEILKQADYVEYVTVKHKTCRNCTQASSDSLLERIP